MGTTPEVGEELTAEMAVENGHQDGSVLAQLREVRARLRRDRTTTLAIPGHDGLLWCRYRLLDVSELTKIANRIARVKVEDHRPLLAAMDTLIAACQEFLVRVDGDLQPLGKTFGLGDDAIRYDARLCEAFGIPEQKEARGVVLALFDNDTAIIPHHNELAEWMQNTSEATDEEFLGESKGATRSETPHSLAP